ERGGEREREREREREKGKWLKKERGRGGSGIASAQTPPVIQWGHLRRGHYRYSTLMFLKLHCTHTHTLSHTHTHTHTSHLYSFFPHLSSCAKAISSGCSQ